MDVTKKYALPTVVLPAVPQKPYVHLDGREPSDPLLAEETSLS